MLFDPHSTDEDTRLDFDQLIRRVNIPPTILEDINNIFAYTKALGKTRNKKFRQLKTLRGVYSSPKIQFKILLYIREIIYPSKVGILWIYSNIVISFILLILVQVFGKAETVFWNPLLLHIIPPIVLLWTFMMFRMIFVRMGDKEGVKYYNPNCYNNRPARYLLYLHRIYAL